MAKGRTAQATRGGEKPPKPAWVWLLSGVALGLLLSGVVLYKDWLPVLRRDADKPAPNPEATAPKSGDAGVAAEAAKPERPKYDFYSVLPEMEVVVPEAEIAQPKATPEVTEAGATRYLLQAGSFRAANDAESMKAKLALIGLRAQVARVEINGTAWHRVRVGPYATTQELADARNTLAANGISSIALKETR